MKNSKEEIKDIKEEEIKNLENTEIKDIKEEDIKEEEIKNLENTENLKSTFVTRRKHRKIKKFKFKNVLK